MLFKFLISNYFSKRTIILIVCPFFLLGQSCKTNSAKTIDNVAEINSVLNRSMPGDTILLEDGIYNDAAIVFNSLGTNDKPIIFCPRNEGKVTFTGKSGIRIGGKYLVVKGFIFRNGFSPDHAVIEFRSESNIPANNCRVTNCVIHSYNQPDRSKPDIWVSLYGKYNRFDHNYLTGKLSNGVTLAVMRDDSSSISNYHQIDHNYFGMRPRLGSNGGETIRVGTSKNSLLPSYTVIENNYFYQCDGEVEIISIKSCDNTIRSNTFVECEGSLVLRHGNNNTVESNIFLGNGKPHTGGIRVINANHKIYNNFLYGLKGDRFRSAFAVMNGVPNSLINRYHQVSNVFIGFNTFVDCDNIGFTIGADNERTAVPEKTLFFANLIVNQQGDFRFTSQNNSGGIEFVCNYVASRSGKTSNNVLTPIKTEFSGINGIPYPQCEIPFVNNQDLSYISKDLAGKPRSENKTVGALQNCDILPVYNLKMEQVTGISWYNCDNPNAENKFAVKTWFVKNPAENLSEILKKINSGDIIELTDTGKFILDVPLEISKKVTVRAAKNIPDMPVLKYSGKNSGFSFFTITNGGSLILEGVRIDGESNGENNPENAIIAKAPMINHYNLWISNCEFSNFTEANYSIVKGEKNTFADSIVIQDSRFSEMSCDAINLASEKDDNGRYNAEYLIVKNCIFHKIMGIAINLYRGGNDESTLGPFLQIDHCTFNEVNNREGGSVLRLIGVQNASVKNTIFSESGKGGFIAKFEEMPWDDCSVEYCNIFNSGKIGSNNNQIKVRSLQNTAPGFKDPLHLNFKLSAIASKKLISSDGKEMGCIRDFKMSNN
jgi:poly(beta-D-mannuronate) lyase